MKTIHNLQHKLQLARQTTRVGFAGLVMVLVINGFYSGVPWVIVLFTILPLGLFVHTLLKESYKGLSLLCFVILMYFMVTVVNLFSPAANIFDWVELIIECVLFNSTMLFSRWKQYSLYQD